MWDAPKGRGPCGFVATSDAIWYASLAGSHIARIDIATGVATVVEPPTKGQGLMQRPDVQARIAELRAEPNELTM
ncbi:MAG: hypothetical protein FJX65_18300 [Alphaproteobacteria bacterium]|nr:hypothetical protein [Alphaproteobacteria bacterium]